MALVRCPECGKQISDKAESCPNCGMSILSKKMEVMVRFPICEGQIFNNKCFVYDKKTGKILASGKQGETVSFKCNTAIHIYAVVKGAFGKPDIIANPGDKFDIGYRGFGKIYISKVDEISGRANTISVGYKGFSRIR